MNSTKALKLSAYQFRRKTEVYTTAQDNMNSEDWEIAVPLFKKLQEDGKNRSRS